MHLKKLNPYKPLSKILALAVGINLVLITNQNTSSQKNEDLQPLSIINENINTKVSSRHIQSDLEYKSRELLFYDDLDKSENDNNMDILSLSAQIDLSNVKEPFEEKIATDWVEPVIVEKPAAKPPVQQQITYNVRVYTDEEIQANALYPYKVPQDDWRTTYYLDNMADAIPTPDMSHMATDDNLYLLAKIIHAEICTLGDEARRCVGTVIINRVWNDDHPNTIYEVIHEPSQFSTKNTKKVPCEECMSAAYDVLVNGYRSFPHYVDAFQAHYDGYFYGHNTYIAFNDGHYKTYFSYKAGKKIYVLE